MVVGGIWWLGFFVFGGDDVQFCVARFRFRFMERSLTYVWHDCFVYRSSRCVIVFDYWRDCDGVLYGPVEPVTDILEECDGLPVYVVVSHHHKDHFNRHVFEWASRFRSVRFVVSRDIARAVRYLLKEGGSYSGRLRVDPECVTVLGEGDVYEDGVVRVSAFGSTDIGNSYVVEADGLTLFHAGDLNAWIWKDESTAAEVEASVREFERRVEVVRSRFPHVDYAMFPVDARIGRDWWEGAWRFVRMIDTGCFIPMHFCLYQDDSERSRFMRSATAFSLYADVGRGFYASMTVPGVSLSL